MRGRWGEGLLAILTGDGFTGVEMSKLAAWHTADKAVT